MRFLVAVRNDFDRFAGRTGAAFAPARRLVSDLARQAKAEARAALRGSRSGRRYAGGVDSSSWKVGKGKGRRGVSKVSTTFRGYVASSPGEAPANRTGQTIRAIRAARVKGGRGLDAGFRFFIFADRRTAFYQRFLEFGIRRRGIGPRPLFAPLEIKFRRRLERELPAALQRGMEEVMRG